MPWYHGDYPPSYKNQLLHLREKATEIANALLAEGMEEGVAIATGLKHARKYFEQHPVDANLQNENANESAESENKQLRANDAYNGSGNINSQEVVENDE